MQQELQQPNAAQRALREFFGYEAFRPGQAEVIEAILGGRDCVAVMPTGAGKSLCYQVPALVFAGTRRATGQLAEFVPQRALVLVISPLVSLMNDQVHALAANGVPAAYLNSQLTAAQQEEVLARASAGAYALLYIAPERLADLRFTAFAASAPIALVAVDEAHCVSQWGQDFRPSYLGIRDFIAGLPQRPAVAAFTATATPRVADDIVRLLELRGPTRVTTGFDRPNLFFGVEQLSDKKKLARIAAYALSAPADSGIIYCSTRKAVEALHEELLAAGVPATRYHAGLSHAERTANQRAFVNDDAPVMVATNAFGMGIDKSNVRYVIHHNMPGSLEAYYQEAGRAGRDGEPSACLLLWNDSDIATARFFIEQESGNEVLSAEEQQAVRASQRRRLAAMTGYCMTAGCLREHILRYFGESGTLENAPGAVGAERMPADTPGTAGAAGAQAVQAAPGAPGVLGTHGMQAAGATPGAPGMLGAHGVQAAPGAHGAHGMQAPAAQGTPPSQAQAAPQVDAVAQAQAAPQARGCNNCSNCTGAVDVVDVTKTARSIMRCVHELRGRYGKGIVADVLRGADNQKMRDFHLTQKKTYGILDDSAALVKEIIEQLCAGDYLEISEGRYPLVGLGPRAREAATNEFSLYMKRPKPKAAAPGAGAGANVGAGRSQSASGTGSRSSATLDTEAERELFERLRQLRKRIADEQGAPPYIVFSDATLRNMCKALPRTDEELLAVSGVGQVKLERYGRAFLDEIACKAPADTTPA